MSSLEPARGYSPSIFGIPRDAIPYDLLKADMERDSIRVVEQMVTITVQNNTRNYLMAPGTNIFVYYRRSKNNEEN